MFIQAAYERMKEAKDAMSVVFKEVSRSLIEDALTKSAEFTSNKQSVKFNLPIIIILKKKNAVSKFQQKTSI